MANSSVASRRSCSTPQNRAAVRKSNACTITDSRARPKSAAEPDMSRLMNVMDEPHKIIRVRDWVRALCVQRETARDVREY
jgi:hypothetical protein